MMVANFGNCCVGLLTPCVVLLNYSYVLYIFPKLVTLWPVHVTLTCFKNNSNYLLVLIDLCLLVS